MVVQVGDSFTAFRSSPDEYVSTKLTADAQEWILSDENTLFFYDPGETNTPLGQNVPAFTIVYASMNPESYRRSNDYTLYMPVWSLEELQACSTLCSYTDEVKASYEFWGGLILLL